MQRVSKIIEKGAKALQDLNLLKLLQSEITHELSSNPFQEVKSGSLGDFVVDWDSLQSQDMVLRRKCETGEEVAVSALLGPLPFTRETDTDDSVFPQNVLMKICVKKPGLKSVLQFDCEVYNKGGNGSEFDIQNAYYLQSSSAISSSDYRGPVFCDLDHRLIGAFKEYLISKGIGESLTNFLILHLHKKEHGQYVNWLKNLESMVTKDE
uniref:Mitochondrial glycoprotein n=1 Tax=Cannabis sativa TaxID=3483 RepID=A0A803P743_CANSA